MTGHVLSDEEVSRIERYGWVIGDTPNLIATIRDRDKTIASQRDNLTVASLNYFALLEQHQLMLSALERIHRYGVEKPFDEHSEAIAFHHVQIISADALAQVKVLTVSKQEGDSDNAEG